MKAGVRRVDIRAPVDESAAIFFSKTNSIHVRGNGLKGSNRKFCRFLQGVFSTIPRLPALPQHALKILSNLEWDNKAMNVVPCCTGRVHCHPMDVLYLGAAGRPCLSGAHVWMLLLHVGAACVLILCRTFCVHP